MYTQYHLSITRQALGPLVSPAALRLILKGNIQQDNLRGQMGHPEYHFDDNAFEQGYRYLADLQAEIIHELRVHKNLEKAWMSFGKLTHASQDFYAHSNYIDLWVENGGNSGEKSFSEKDILLPEILNDPKLISGRSYNPWGLITILPWIGPIFAPLLPADSHARLNKDSPSRNVHFPLAYQAAVYRTIYEYNELIRQFDQPERDFFSGNAILLQEKDE